MSDLFIEKTLSVLSNYEPRRVSVQSFNISDSDMKEEHCVLIMGLNPAGDENDAEREKSHRTYYYSVETSNNNRTGFIYNQYFRPILDFVDNTIGSAKWPWCNMSFDQLVTEIESYTDLLPYKEALIKHYRERKENTHTIYIGDMFYYHETNSKELPLTYRESNTSFYNVYCQEMLKMHIDCLRQHNKTIDYVYINNAQVSRWLCNGSTKTMSEIDGVDVFYGGMLSGMRSMDVFSRERLINEIKKALQRKDL